MLRVIIPILAIIGFIVNSWSFITGYPLWAFLDRKFPRVDLAYHVLESETFEEERFPIRLSEEFCFSGVLLGSVGKAGTDNLDVCIENLRSKIAILKIVSTFKPYLLRDLETRHQFKVEDQVGKKSIEFRIERFLPEDYCYVIIGVASGGKSLFRTSDITIVDGRGHRAKELVSLFEFQRRYKYSRITNWSFVVIIIILVLSWIIPKMVKRQRNGK